ncbi:hypothetical protein WJX81_006729 [Elliptochloris bilobata]|uniref:Uncharacterized protein n=1 Tax=Elliptochloris bilobata TaxID=381761 RepID=A0AAW1QK21_9CHLO
MVDSLAGLLETSGRAPTAPGDASSEALTRRHSIEGMPKHAGNSALPKPDWTHHLERYKRRAEDKEAHRQDELEGKALDINPTLKNLVAVIAPCLATPQDASASGVRKQGIHEE